MKSSTVVKWYCSPFCSFGRGGRVVYEIDRRIAVVLASSALTSVDLPAPDGATTMNRLPG